MVKSCISQPTHRTRMNGDQNDRLKFKPCRKEHKKVTIQGMDFCFSGKVRAFHNHFAFLDSEKSKFDFGT